jgi:hypothetical protein
MNTGCSCGYVCILCLEYEHISQMAVLPPDICCTFRMAIFKKVNKYICIYFEF